MLRLGTSELEARESELTSFVGELAEREAQLARSEEELARRRQELGAVELKRASVERRERAVAAREEELAELEATLDERAAALPRSGHGDSAVEVELVFVPGERYRVVEIAAAELARGNAFELEGDAFVVARVGRLSAPRGSAPLRLPRARAATQRVARRQLVDGRSAFVESVRVADRLEPLRRLGDEELGDGDVVLAETAVPHLVELDEPHGLPETVTGSMRSAFMPRSRRMNASAGSTSPSTKETALASPLRRTSAVSGKSAMRYAASSPREISRSACSVASTM